MSKIQFDMNPKIPSSVQPVGPPSAAGAAARGPPPFVATTSSAAAAAGGPPPSGSDQLSIAPSSSSSVRARLVAELAKTLHQIVIANQRYSNMVGPSSVVFVRFRKQLDEFKAKYQKPGVSFDTDPDFVTVLLLDTLFWGVVSQKRTTTELFPLQKALEPLTKNGDAPIDALKLIETHLVPEAESVILEWPSAAASLTPGGSQLLQPPQMATTSSSASLTPGGPQLLQPPQMATTSRAAASAAASGGPPIIVTIPPSKASRSSHAVQVKKRTEELAKKLLQIVRTRPRVSPTHVLFKDFQNKLKEFTEDFQKPGLPIYSDPEYRTVVFLNTLFWGVVSQQRSEEELLQVQKALVPFVKNGNAPITNFVLQLEEQFMQNVAAMSSVQAEAMSLLGVAAPAPASASATSSSRRPPSSPPRAPAAAPAAPAAPAAAAPAPPSPPRTPQTWHAISEEDLQGWTYQPSSSDEADLPETSVTHNRFTDVIPSYNVVVPPAPGGATNYVPTRTAEEGMSTVLRRRLNE